MSPTSHEPDEHRALLTRVARGESAALAELYDRLSGTVMAVAVRVLGDHAAAEDVVQEVFVQVWEKAAAYDRRLGTPLGWVVVMARNRAIDRLRSVQRREQLARNAAQIVSEPPPGWSAAEETDDARQVMEAVERLPGEQREAVELAFHRGLTQVEIAEKLGVPLGTVKARIRRGLLRLRDELEGLL